LASPSVAALVYRLVIVSVRWPTDRGAVDVADVVVRQAAPEGAAGDDVVVTDGGRADRAGAAQADARDAVAVDQLTGARGELGYPGR
jgi:hypothetical protein